MQITEHGPTRAGILPSAPRSRTTSAIRTTSVRNPETRANAEPHTLLPPPYNDNAPPPTRGDGAADRAHSPEWPPSR